MGDTGVLHVLEPARGFLVMKSAFSSAKVPGCRYVSWSPVWGAYNLKVFRILACDTTARWGVVDICLFDCGLDQ